MFVKLKEIFGFIYNLFPYKYSRNNKIFIVKNGRKTQYKGKIKGLNIVYEKTSKDNYLELHLPLKFEKTTIYFRGSSAKMTIMNTSNTIREAAFYCSSYGEIFIDEDSRFTMPNVVIKTNNNTIENPSKVVIGKSVQMGQDVMIRTSDGHSIFNIGENIPYNAPEDIIIGDNVWVGERVVIIKGSYIPNNTIIGISALVNKKFAEENTIIAGVPAKVVKRNVSWLRTPYGFYMRSLNTIPKIPNKKEVFIKKLKRKISKIFRFWF